MNLSLRPQLILFFVLLCIGANAQPQNGLLVAQRYTITGITNAAGTNVYPIAETDSFVLRSNGSFTFYVAAENSLPANGNWQQKADTLLLSYITPTDTLRKFFIRKNGENLELSENGFAYTFAQKNANKLHFVKTGFTLRHFGRGVLGLVALVALAWLFSANRRGIKWGLVLKGLAMQVVLALAILKVPFIERSFDYVGRGFVAILGFTRQGSLFLFGSIVENTESFGYIFAFQVLPTVVFFSALTSLLYYYNILQKVVFAFAWIMKRTLKLSGAESLAAAGNIFLGQTEAPLLVKPYIKNMTRSELLCLMTGGMATIAGGVLAAYINYLGGPDPANQLFFARHLLTASVMSAPAAIVAAKILLPETETFSSEMKISPFSIGSNWLDAIANGTTDGLKLAINVGAMLLVFTAMIYMFNAILGDIIGANTGLNAWVARVSDGNYSQFSMQFILGYSLAPLTWLMGVDGTDVTLVAQLLGEKTILNEFYAYVTMGDMVHSGAFANQRSIIIATYILCGFANFASIGIQIGGIGALAPNRRSDLSKLGIKALIGGTIASLFTAVIVGMLV